MRLFLRRLKRIAMEFLGRGYFPKPVIRCATVQIGAGYGAWDVVLEGLDRTSIVYSFGIGEDVSFDVGLTKATGAVVHGFDPTPKSIEWVRRQGLPPTFDFRPWGIADYDGTARFHAPTNPEHVSHTMLERGADGGTIEVVVKRLATIMAELGHAKLDLLKMDIEGAEYDVIKDLEKSAIRPRQLLIEFHHRFPEVGRARTEEALQRLSSMGYRLFSVSDTGEEFGFMLAG